MVFDLTDAKVVMVCSPESDNNFKNSMLADKVILEKDGEKYLVESSHGILNICKII